MSPPNWSIRRHENTTPRSIANRRSAGDLSGADFTGASANQARGEDGGIAASRRPSEKALNVSRSTGPLGLRTASA
jgi:hypothetical protein